MRPSSSISSSVLFDTLQLQYQEELLQEQQEQIFYSHVDLFFGVSYLCIGVFAVYQLITQSSLSMLLSSSPSSKKSQKVITIFNLLIVLTCVFRSIWFFIPNQQFYKYYLNNAIDCHESNFYNLFVLKWKEAQYSESIRSRAAGGGGGGAAATPLSSSSSPNHDVFFQLYHLQEKDLNHETIWIGKFLSESISLLAMICMDSIFILITSYWYFMHKKVELLNQQAMMEEGTPPSPYNPDHPQQHYPFSNPDKKPFTTNYYSSDEDTTSLLAHHPHHHQNYQSIQRNQKNPSSSLLRNSSSSPNITISPSDQAYLLDGRRDFTIACITLRFDSLELFYFFFTLMLGVYFLLLGLFYSEVINSQQLLLINSLWSLSLCSIIYWKMNVLSKYVIDLLQIIELQNQTSTATQIHRIQGIAFVASIFCLGTIGVELLMSVYLIILFRGTKYDSISMNHFLFKSYLLLKYGIEMIVLLLELLIAIPIKSYDNRRVLFRQIPLPTRFYHGTLPLEGAVGGEEGITTTKTPKFAPKTSFTTNPPAYNPGIAYGEEHDYDADQETDKEAMVYSETRHAFSQQRRFPQVPQEDNFLPSGHKFTELTPVLRGDSIGTYQTHNIRYV